MCSRPISLSTDNTHVAVSRGCSELRLHAVYIQIPCSLAIPIVSSSLSQRLGQVNKYNLAMSYDLYITYSYRHNFYCNMLSRPKGYVVVMKGSKQIKPHVEIKHFVR